MLITDESHRPKTSDDLCKDQSRKEGEVPLIEEMVPAFLEHLRVEGGRSGGTVVRYQSHLRRFVAATGNCRIDAVDSEKLYRFKRALLDASLAPVTVAAVLSGLRSFLRFVRATTSWDAFDPERIRRPRVPWREVGYLTKSEVQRFLNAIPTRSFAGVRDRALAEVLCATGMRIAEAVSLNRTDVDWDNLEAMILGKGGKERKVYFTQGAVTWVQRHLEWRHDSGPALFT